MSFAAGKTGGTLSHQTDGTSPKREHGSLPGNNAKPTSTLPPLNTNQLKRETQRIVIQFPTKAVAEQQGGTERAVEDQRNGESCMSLRAAVNMCRANPRARAQFARLLGFSGAHTDPDFMEGMEKLAQGYLRQQAAMFGIAVPESSADEARDVGNSSLDCAGEEVDCLTGDLFEAMGNA